MLKIPFHLLPTGKNPPTEIFCLVEIPKGCSNKYELDLKTGAFRLDRVLYESVFFPTEYGIIPRTWSLEDNDPLDVMVLSSFPTFTGCVIACRPIGLMRINDSGERDDKIIAIPTDDPRFKNISDLNDVNPHLKKEIKNFWENYAQLQPNKKIKFLGWSQKQAAWETIRKAMKIYESKSW